MELIPGIPDDVARECLIRFHYKQLPTVVSVCRSWKSEIELPRYSCLRRAACSSQLVVVMAQACVEMSESESLQKHRAPPVYRLSVLEPGTGDWSLLPAVSVDGESYDNLPLFCQLVSVGSDLFVFGGLNPSTWEVSSSVFAYSFLTASWRKGADIPGPRRSFFGCAADEKSGIVYIAGGHDEEKNALKSAMAYDAAKDEWTNLPDMASERDECKALFQCGKLHVIGGYSTDMQGRFQTSVEMLDVNTQCWETLDELLSTSVCPRTCSFAGDDGNLLICRDGQVMERIGTNWQAVSKLPNDVITTAYVSVWQGNLMIIGSAKFGDPYVAYLLNLETRRWTKVENPAEFSGHVQSGCYLIL